MKLENISMLRRSMCYTYIDEGSTPSISTKLETTPYGVVFDIGDEKVHSCTFGWELKRFYIFSRILRI